ncbi:MAG: ABC transporter substrate-binding protein [Actinomycetota bacterium]|nr:ABC transporter substrate-binding protein [Actinomycetota bacterium]
MNSPSPVRRRPGAPYPSARRSGARRFALLAVMSAVAIVAASCGGGGDDDASGGGDDAPGAPTRGGTVVYGLEAETSEGWCLPEASLAISGIQVARAIYDTLTIPDENAEYQPFLAESVEPNEDDTVWTIRLRPDITFHDGSPLDAEVVKNNIDAYRGEYPGRTALQYMFVFENMADVTVVDPLTVQITTKTPWPALPAALFGSGRVGMVAQAQLDDPETCDSKLIGTGPFVLDEWKVDESLTATRNPDYWGTDAEGEQLPYLDAIEFRPLADGNSRVNTLLSGEIQAAHMSMAEDIEVVTDEAESGGLEVISSADFGEVGYQMLNTAKPPFDNKLAREAVVKAIDMDTYNSVRNQDLMTNANGPFAPGEIGHLDDTGYPTYDLDAAKKAVAAYEAETGQPLEFTISLSPDAGTVSNMQVFQEMFTKAGITSHLETIPQAKLIDTAIAKDFQMLDWRNHPGGNPDGQFDWWKSGSVLNFSSIDDPEIDRLLLEGRAERDVTERQRIYGEINERFATELYNLWMQWTQWTVATSPTVHGVMGPALPDGAAPFPGLATGHSVAGLWVEQ